jgi:hypothetical protein
MQTSSFDDWLTRPLRTGICPTPGLWPTIPWREVGLTSRTRGAATPSRSENVETEKLRILKMLEEKKITADEAARLLEALDRVGSRPTERELKRRWVHIRVEQDGDETVNVKVPLALLKLGFKLAPHALGGSSSVGRHAEHVHERAERAHERAERAHEKAELIKEKIRRKLEAKLGPDADLDELNGAFGDLNGAFGDLNGAFSEAFQGLNEEHGPHTAHAEHGHGALGGLDLDIEKILEMAQEEGFDGKLLDVYDDEEDKRVTIRLE